MMMPFQSLSNEAPMQSKGTAEQKAIAALECLGELHAKVQARRWGKERNKEQADAI